MALTQTQKNLIKKSIADLRCGGVDKEGVKETSFNGLIQLFALNIAERYGWSSGLSGVSNVFGTWTLSYKTEQSPSSLIERYKAEKLKELIEYKISEQGIESNTESRGHILKEISTKAAYTLLHQHVFVRIHEMLPATATLETPDISDDWGDFGDLEDWGELEDWEDESESDEESESESDEETLIEDIRNKDGSIKAEHARDVRKKPLNSAYDGVAYHNRRNLGTTWSDNQKNALLLNGYFDEFSIEFPGLFQWDGDLELQYVPRLFNTHDLLIQKLGVPGLFSMWADPLTFGWIYQFWNDPYKAVLNTRSNVVGFEIASKTQLFSEQYMVEWLLQNALGRKWMEICKKNGWKSIVESTGTLDTLEKNRQSFRALRQSGTVGLTEMMNRNGKLEEHWCYYVDQPIDDTSNTPSSIRELRLIDPACGSGHFLVIALDYLVQLYKEEAKHRGEEGQDQWSNAKIVESILENNLHGLDIDPRAVQIAMCSVYLQGRKLAGGISPKTFNIGAPDFGIGTLHTGDDLFDKLAKEIEQDTEIPARLLNDLLSNLRNAHYIGTLLKVEEGIERVLSRYQTEKGRLFVDSLKVETLRESIILKIQTFLTTEDNSKDLQTELRKSQLEKSAKYLSLNRSDYYDVVVGNPPYLGMGDVHKDSKVYFEGTKGRKGIPGAYPRAKSDLYACFLERGLELVKKGGISAMITMRGWMFIKSYTAFRANIFKEYRICLLGDLDRGAFSEIAAGPGGVATVMSILQRSPSLDSGYSILAKDRSYISGSDITERTRAGLLCQYERYDYNIERLSGIEGWPLIYWWDEDFLQRYLDADKLGIVAPGRKGIDTGNNTQFSLKPWELTPLDLNFDVALSRYMPLVMGSKGLKWFEPLQNLIKWKNRGLMLHTKAQISSGATIRSPQFLGKKHGIAYSTIGQHFSTRVYTYPSIVECSFIFRDNFHQHVLVLNTKNINTVINALNPTVNFTVGDVNRLPLFSIEDADQIYKQLNIAFTEHESRREPSVEFKKPGPSCWDYAQDWAQTAVDSPAGTPLPTYTPEYKTEPDTDHLSYALGVALGRFKPDGTGIIDPENDNLDHALPHGFLFLDGTIPENIFDDGLNTRHKNNPNIRVCQNIIDTWTERGNNISSNLGLRKYLRTRFFSDIHLRMYEKRPIHWPLSSSNRTFVVWVNIHRMNHQTFLEIIKVLRKRVDGLNQTITQGTPSELESVQALEELEAFANTLEKCILYGPENTNNKASKVEALYKPDLDDGVMINAAALWPVLHPQWKSGNQVPKNWWISLCKDGPKNFDWAHLTKCYFPERVEKKCQTDPSLAVAHGCFWKYHASRAWQWELRLQDEIGSTFILEEKDHKTLRSEYFANHSLDAIENIDGEISRRIRNFNNEEGSKPPTSIALLHPGLWTAEPNLLRQLEHKYTEQGNTFIIHASDRPQD